jgi:hypothetical protein
MPARRVAALLLALIAGVCDGVQAQTDPPLVGPARDVARAVLVAPAVFDPLLVSPLTPEPQAVIDVNGSDSSAAFHAALRSGDDSYGILVSAPIRPGNSRISAADPRGLRTHPSLGFDLTNVIWQPKARPALERLLQAGGHAQLSPARRDAVERAIRTTDAVAVPWVMFFHLSYRFNRDEYRYADPATLAPRSETRLNDTATALGGMQFLVRGNDPGYFVGFSYTYSAVFRNADAVDGVTIGGPSKIRGNLFRVDVRRPIPRTNVGVDGSYTYDASSQTRTIDAATYVVIRSFQSNSSTKFYGGVRVGHSTGAGGAFVTVFAGPVFRTRP